MDKDEIYASIICALTHTYETCDACKKCKGNNGIEVRMNLIRELATVLNKPLPWKEEEK